MIAPEGLGVLIVDDEADIRAALSQTLQLADLSVAAVADADAAAAALAAKPGGAMIGAVVCDVKMPGRSGLELLAEIAAADPELPVVMLTGHGDVDMAVEAMRAGAYDFLEKPVGGRRLVDTLARALSARRLVLENRKLRNALRGGDAEGAKLLGDTPAMATFRTLLEKVSRADADLLILGETGSGKEVAARAAHAMSPRRDGRFVAVNCGALPSELAESELFGHMPGAFTGAAKRRVGKFVYADGGTIFLDEIESMPLGLQVALLRVLQEREVEPVGADAPQPIDVRVVAATKVDLRALADAGAFREDLYYRLEVARLELPPLRERIEDAPLLFDAFVAEASARRRVEPPRPNPALRAWLLSQAWPGNVRELRNAAERHVLGLPVGPFDADEAIDGDPALGLTARVDAYERRLIVDALEASDGRVVEACRSLGLPRNTLYDKLRKHGLGRSG